jgi:signal transduction histidine kinase
LNPVAAAVAFFALGVTVFGTALLLLFNPRSSSVRWFAAFQAVIAVWLSAQGWALGIGGWPRALPIVSGAVHLMPAMFLAFALHDRRRDWLLPLSAVALGLALLPLDLGSLGRVRNEGLLMAWNLGAWGAATALVVSEFRSGRAAGPQRRLGYWVLAGLVVVFPAGVVAGMTRGAVVLYLMPMLMVWVQLLIFIGVVRLRFYDIEVRAVRTGDLAAATAERERLAVLGELAASLAHEVRNPLTGVRSLAQRLAEEDVDDEKRRRYAGVILEESARVERLVANLLGIARRAPRPGAPGRTELAPLFEDLSLLTQGRAERAQVRIAADAGRAAADASREPLAQALLNLLLNAVNHSPAGATVTLSAAAGSGGTRIWVRDQGRGVPAEDRERIWEAFHTSGDGTGLGLAVVRRLAEEAGWTLEVADAPGGGAEFTIFIPAASPASSPALSR